MAHATAAQPITVGVDTHLDSHVATPTISSAAASHPQRPTTPTGYQDLLAWARGLGQPIAWGVDGTGSYGAALARFLAANGQVEMIRVLGVADRPRSGPAPRPSMPSRRCWSPPRPSCASSCGTYQPPPGGSHRRPGPGPDHQPTGGGHARTGHPRPPPPGPQPRDQGPHRRAGPAHRHPSPPAGGALGHRPRQHRRAAGRCRGQPQRLRNEACFCDAVWFLTDPGVLGQDRPAPPQPGW